ncbi:Protein ENL [Oryzias melastigma]|uniref:Protein ENL n=1 Tax=Oryzias melastigma TaxID=30732 RepID=A0A834FHP4_ORYME|nr:Protein ENL [Oryzias melastigma]
MSSYLILWTPIEEVVVVVGVDDAQTGRSVRVWRCVKFKDITATEWPGRVPGREGVCAYLCVCELQSARPAHLSPIASNPHPPMPSQLTSCSLLRPNSHILQPFPQHKCTVQVKLELGHRAQLRKKVTSEGFTHDWMVFVRGPETGAIQHFVDKVIFRLHESFPKPKRVCKEPPYKVEESGYAGFLMPIEVYFKNREEPKRVCFNYDLFLNLEGNPPVNHLRCEKLTFNNPTREFRKKLIKAGGILVVPEGAEAVSRPSPDYPMLPTIPLSAFSDPKKTKTSHVSKEPSKDGSGGSSKAPKSHKLTKEHRERPRKDSESKAMSKGDDRDGSTKSGRDPSSSSSSSSKKPSDIKAKEDVKVLPKAAFKEPKLTLKESKMEGMSPKGGGAGSGGGGGGGGGSVECKAPGKRPSTLESPKPSTKKQKKGSSEGPKGPSGGAFTGTSPRVSSSSAPSQSYSEKKPPKDKSRWAKSKNDSQELKESKKPPDSEESNSEDEASSKSEVRFS